MTVATETRSVEYDGDGVTAQFPVPFERLDVDHVRVTYTPASGPSVVLTRGTNPGYVNTDVLSDVKNVFPVTASVPTEVGATITVERVVPITQGIDFSNLTAFDPETHEEGFDLGVMVDQQLADRISALEGGTLPAMSIGNGLEQIAGPTLQVKEHSDGSIAVGTGGVQVGVLATDAQHGARGGGTQHANAISGGAAGFQSGTDKQRSDALWIRTITAGAGLTGGGDLSANRTIDVVANADGSIVVNANDVQVGTLATDAQHGVRGGGTQHADVVAAGASGFMTGADKTKLDGLVAQDELENSFDLDGNCKTADETVTTILSWTPTDDSVEHFEAQVVGLTQNAGKAAGYRINGAVRRNDGTTSIIDAVVVDADETTIAWDATIDVSSPDVRVRVTGEAATTIRWSVIVRRRRLTYAG